MRQCAAVLCRAVLFCVVCCTAVLQNDQQGGESTNIYFRAWSFAVELRYFFCESSFPGPSSSLAFFLRLVSPPCYVREEYTYDT